MGIYAVWAVAIALLAYRLYRRSRTFVGEHIYSEKAFKRRLSSLTLVLVILVWADVVQVQQGLQHPGNAVALALAATLAGIAGGVALGLWGARLAEFRWDGGALKLRAHAYIGPVILALYVLRIAYKFWLIHELGLLNTPISQAAMPALQRELALFDLNAVSSLLRGLVFAYFFIYYPLLMRRGRAQQRSAMASVAQP